MIRREKRLNMNATLTPSSNRIIGSAVYQILADFLEDISGI